MYSSLSLSTRAGGRGRGTVPPGQAARRALFQPGGTQATATTGPPPPALRQF